MKTWNVEPPIFRWTKQQLEALSYIQRFLQHPTQRKFILKGYAGSGKTSLISRTIRPLTFAGARIVVVAPTNKAVAVIRGMMESIGLTDIECRTIHSLLGISLVRYEIYNSIEEEFRARGSNRPSLKVYDIVVIDEGSMIPKGICEYFNKRIEAESNAKVIIMGDPAQLPPVGEPYASMLEGSPSYELTDVVRTKKDNYILPVVTEIRNNIDNPKPISSHKSNMNGDEGIQFYRSKAKFVAGLRRALKNGCGFNNGIREVMVLAWSGNMVTHYNRLIREILFKRTELNTFELGDIVLADKPFADIEGNMILHTADDGIVVNVEPYDNEYNIEGINLSIELFDGGQVVVPVLTKKGDAKLKRVLKKIKNEAIGINKLQNKKKWSRKWKDFYNLRDNFAAIKHGYATTVHKSQGTTCENVFIVETNIDMNPDVVERNKCKYVAYSRASKSVHCLWNPLIIAGHSHNG